MPAVASPWHTAPSRIVVLAVALLFAFGACEFAAYWFGPGYEERFTIIDSVRGWKLRPGFGGWTAKENHLFIRINSDGLRDREHPRAKPPHTLRIAVLGDSYMQAMNVPWPDAFPARLESELRGCLAPLVPEVVNFGVSGYGTAQEALAFETHAAAYQPDLVLTALYAGNDLTDNYGPTADPYAPFYVLDGDTLSLDTSFRSRSFADQPWHIRARMALTERSRVLMLLYQPWVAFRDWQRTQAAPPDGEENDGLDALRGADLPRIEGEWAVTEAVLARLTDLVRSAGAEPWLASVTMAEQVDPDLNSRRALQQRLGVTDLFYPERRLSAFAEQRRLAYVPLAPPLAAIAAERHVFLHGGMNARVLNGEGHWNAMAQRLAAPIVAERICRDSAAVARARGTVAAR